MPEAVKFPATYEVCRFLSEMLFRLCFSLKVEGLENIPEEKCMLASNHVSFLDPPLLGCSIKTPVHYLARKTLFKPPVMDWLLPRINVVPVDLEKADMVGLKRIIGLLRSGDRVVMFPEGTRSPDGKLQKGQPGVGFVLSKAPVPIVPIRIFGAYEAWPKNSKLKFFMSVRVVYGKPFEIDRAILKDKKRYQEAGQLVMDKIAELR